jgi:hypothetical protein
MLPDVAKGRGNNRGAYGQRGGIATMSQRSNYGVSGRRLWSAMKARYPLRVAAVLLLIAVAGCSRGSTSSYLQSSVPANQARIWVYRGGSIYDSPQSRTVRLNGARIGVSQLNSAFYRDVAPGHYHLTVDTYGSTFVQDSDVDLAAGDEVFVRVTSQFNAVNGGGDLFAVAPMPAAQARIEIAGLSFDDGSGPTIPSIPFLTK